MTADEILLAPAIAEVERDHPRRRVVPTMYTLAGEQLRTRQLRTQQPYDDVVAEQWARAFLMPVPAWLRAPARQGNEAPRLRRHETARGLPGFHRYLPMARKRKASTGRYRMAEESAGVAQQLAAARCRAPLTHPQPTVRGATVLIVFARLLADDRHWVTAIASGVAPASTDRGRGLGAEPQSSDRA